MKKIYVVGMGPGNKEYMTNQAIEAMTQSETLFGYTVYLDLLQEMFPEKEMVSTPMKQEIERCRLALEEADKGKVVSMVCSGDAGVYGMAGLIYQLAEKDFKDIEIEIVPGITAAISGAAVLGAALIHDFAVISLSDLLTPMEKIEKRIACAADGDFVMCIYNPSSKKRHDYLKKACDIIMKYQSEDLVCGTVKNIGRDGQESKIMTIKELRDTEVDMFTTIFIGNSSTKVINGKMVTPRGYEKRM